MKQVIIIDDTPSGWTATIRGGETFALPHSMDASRFDVADDVRRMYPNASICFLQTDPLFSVGTRD